VDIAAIEIWDGQHRTGQRKTGTTIFNSEDTVARCKTRHKKRQIAKQTNHKPNAPYMRQILFEHTALITDPGFGTPHKQSRKIINIQKEQQIWARHN
jgi:hypothetical protein